jgi:hypothetical protein
LKLEFELSKKGTSKVIAWLVAGAIIGFLAATVIAPSFTGAKCLTTADLNRTAIDNDLVIASRLSRFCEGMGLASQVLPQKDADGKVIYYLPICVEPPQQ